MTWKRYDNWPNRLYSSVPRSNECIAQVVVDRYYSIDDGREVLFDFAANSTIWELYLEGLCMWHYRSTRVTLVVHWISCQ